MQPGTAPKQEHSTKLINVLADFFRDEGVDEHQALTLLAVSTCVLAQSTGLGFETLVAIQRDTYERMERKANGG